MEKLIIIVYSLIVMTFFGRNLKGNFSYKIHDISYVITLEDSNKFMYQKFGDGHELTIGTYEVKKNLLTLNPKKTFVEEIPVENLAMRVKYLKILNDSTLVETLKISKEINSSDIKSRGAKSNQKKIEMVYRKLK